jgi:hypothetical protein
VRFGRQKRKKFDYGSEICGNETTWKIVKDKEE